MNPAVEAAWIAAGVSLLSLGGTVAVAISAHRTTLKASDRVLEAGTSNTVRALDAARDDRLWDKRTATYQETITYLLYLQAKRRNVLRIHRLPTSGEKLVEELFASYKPPGWFELQGRLGTYGSEAVIRAFEVSAAADSVFDARYAEWTADSPPKLSRAEADAAWQPLDAAVKDAEAKNQAVIELMRSELHSKPSQTLTRSRRNTGL